MCNSQNSKVPTLYNYVISVLEPTKMFKRCITEKKLIKHKTNYNVNIPYYLCEKIFYVDKDNLPAVFNDY